MPALVTRISTGPSSALMRSKPVRTDGRSATSTSTAMAVAPSPRSSSAAVSAAAPTRSTMATPIPVGREPPGHAETDARGPTGDDGDAAHRPASAASNSRCSLESPRRIQVGSYRKVRSPGGPWCSSDRRMFRVRSRMRSMLTRPSARAKGPPGQEWAPRPKAMWVLGVGAVALELGRALEVPRVAVGGAVEQHDRCAGGDLDASDGGRAAGQAEVGLHRALDPQHLFEEVGDAVCCRPAARPAVRGARPGA